MTTFTRRLIVNPTHLATRSSDAANPEHKKSRRPRGAPAALLLVGILLLFGFSGPVFFFGELERLVEPDHVLTRA